METNSTGSIIENLITQPVIFPTEGNSHSNTSTGITDSDNENDGSLFSGLLREIVEASASVCIVLSILCVILFIGVKCFLAAYKRKLRRRMPDVENGWALANQPSCSASRKHSITTDVTAIGEQIRSSITEQIAQAIQQSPEPMTTGPIALHLNVNLPQYAPIAARSFSTERAHVKQSFSQSTHGSFSRSQSPHRVSHREGVETSTSPPRATPTALAGSKEKKTRFVKIHTSDTKLKPVKELFDKFTKKINNFIKYDIQKKYRGQSPLRKSSAKEESVIATKENQTLEKR